MCFALFISPSSFLHPFRPHPNHLLISPLLISLPSSSPFSQSSSTSLGDEDYVRNKGASNVELEFLSSLRHAVGNAESKENEDGGEEKEDGHSLQSEQDHAPQSVLTYNDEHEPSMSPFFSQPSPQAGKQGSPMAEKHSPNTIQKKTVAPSSTNKKEVPVQDLSTFSMSSAQLRKTLAGAYTPFLLHELGSRKMRQVQVKRGVESITGFSFALDHAIALGRDYEEGLASLADSEILASEEELVQV
jgi:hypothetical protein